MREHPASYDQTQLPAYPLSRARRDRDGQQANAWQTEGVRVLLAPHHFGRLLTPDIAARALAGGWARAKPDDEVIIHPHSDGSTGFLDVVPGSTEILTVTAGASSRPVSIVRQEQDGKPWHTVYCHTDSFTADGEVSMGDVIAGSSAPIGEVLAAAVSQGAQRIVVGTGHTPWHDAGAGLLTELASSLGLPGADGGVRDGEGTIAAELADLVGPLREKLAPVSIVVASAREVPLRGLHGAGAELAELPLISAAEAQHIETLTAPFVNAVESRAKEFASRSLLGADETLLSRRAYAGAGGGVAFILSALGARVYPGAWVTGEETGLNAAIASADLVVTGAEVIAGQELGEGVVADAAARAGVHAIPVVAVGGRVDASRRQLFKVGIHASYPVIDTPAGRPQLTAPVVTEAALVARGERLARTWSRR